MNNDRAPFKVEWKARDYLHVECVAYTGHSRIGLIRPYLKWVEVPASTAMRPVMRVWEFYDSTPEQIKKKEEEFLLDIMASATRVKPTLGPRFYVVQSSP
jgi:hypothetical protein